MRSRRGPLEAEPIERLVHISRPLEEVAAAFRGDPDDDLTDVVLVVDEPARLTWELTRAGLRGTRLSLEFTPDGDGTVVLARLDPRMGGMLVRLRRRWLTRRYERIVEGVLERARADLEGDDEPDGDSPSIA